MKNVVEIIFKQVKLLLYIYIYKTDTKNISK